MTSANEPEIARAISLLFHEAALIDCYSIAGLKSAARSNYTKHLRDASG